MSFQSEGVFVAWWFVVAVLFVFVVVGIPAAFYLGRKWIAVAWLRFLLILFTGVLALESIGMAWQLSVSVAPGIQIADQLDPDGSGEEGSEGNANGVDPKKAWEALQLQVSTSTGPILWRFSFIVFVLVVAGFLGRRDELIDPLEYLMENNLSDSDVSQTVIARIPMPLTFRFGVMFLREFDLETIRLAKSSWYFLPHRMLSWIWGGFDENAEQFSASYASKSNKILLRIKASTDYLAAKNFSEYKGDLLKNLRVQLTTLRNDDER